MITSKERKCKWEKWIDPLNANLDEVEWPGHEPEVEPTDVEFLDFSQENVATIKQNIDENFFRNLSRKIHSIRPLKVINTRMGLLTVTENAVADYHFDFWTLHTNFAITQKIGETICNAPGVDAFIPMTRYRCRIGFPKSGLFNVTQAKLEIERLITQPEVDNDSASSINPIFTDDIQAKINDKIEELKLRSKYWALYVLPNGSMEILESETLGDTFNTKIQIFRESEKLAGGKVFMP
jgi:hypothetical protein